MATVYHSAAANKMRSGAIMSSGFAPIAMNEVNDEEVGLDACMA